MEISRDLNSQIIYLISDFFHFKTSENLGNFTFATLFRWFYEKSRFSGKVCQIFQLNISLRNPIPSQDLKDISNQKKKNWCQDLQGTYCFTNHRVLHE